MTVGARPPTNILLVSAGLLDLEGGGVPASAGVKRHYQYTTVKNRGGGASGVAAYLRSCNEQHFLAVKIKKSTQRSHLPAHSIGMYFLLNLFLISAESNFSCKGNLLVSLYRRPLTTKILIKQPDSTPPVGVSRAVTARAFNCVSVCGVLVCIYLIECCSCLRSSVLSC